jgi:hypothetical protein
MHPVALFDVLTIYSLVNGTSAKYDISEARPSLKLALAGL